MLLASLIWFSSCGINQQAKQIKALEQCQFKVQQVDRVFLAGVDVLKLAKAGHVDLGSVGGISLAMLRKNVPLDAVVHIHINNPTNNLAGINQFQYQIVMKDQEIATGTIDQQVRVGPGESIDLPLGFQSNIYGLLSNQSVMEDLLNFISGKDPKQETLLSIKLKPTLSIGNKLINYPGWITFDRKLSRSALIL